MILRGTVRRLTLALAAVVLVLSAPIGPSPAERNRKTDPPDPPTARITADQAKAAAVNTWEPTMDGLRLRHPRHTVLFSQEGMQFRPRRGGPSWGWRLTQVGATGVIVTAVSPQRDASGGVSYVRGELVEQYLAGQTTIEQQFLIPRRLRLEGADLVIAGEVSCTGRFEATKDGWSWDNGKGAIHLGNVRVYDAAGRTVPARMMVRADETRILVDGKALEEAAYPVTIDPEIGTNDYRISFMGHDLWYDAHAPAIAYNTADNEYLVVWDGDTNHVGGLTDDEFEIYGQRIDAANGNKLGEAIKISHMGSEFKPSGPGFEARCPAVAYNTVDNQYLVVWYGDDDRDPLVDDEYEIFGQRLSADGSSLGVDDFRISDMGPDGDIRYFAYNPAATFNPHKNEYLVVWSGDDNTLPLIDAEFEIFGQLLSADGSSVGVNDFRISDMGPDSTTLYGADKPAVSFSFQEDLYLVVWQGDDNNFPLVQGESEIFGQVLSDTGASLYTNDFRISDMGPDGDRNFGAYNPKVAYNSLDNEYLVVWHGDDDTGLLVDREFEIYGQRLSPYGTQLGANDFRISSMGPDGDIRYSGVLPAAVYHRQLNQYLVVWKGIDNTAPLVLGEEEILGQRLNADGTAVGENDFRISQMGPDGDSLYAASLPALAYNRLAYEYLVVWQGDDDTPPLVDDEVEIFGQRLRGSGAQTGIHGFRISYMGIDSGADAEEPDVSYNPAANEYLVVWSGDDVSTSLADGEFEIWGQKVDGATGKRIGVAFRISDMGPVGDPGYRTYHPAVAYNGLNQEYLVVWSGDDNTPPLGDGEFEIFGQRLTSAGLPVGTNDFRISDMGPNGNESYDALLPDVAYNNVLGEYLVVWYGDDNTAPLIDQEFEIFGQRLSAAGAALGTNDFRISDMGPDSNANYAALSPAVAYNPLDNQYLVVWSGDDDTGFLVDDEFEIFGQLLSGAGAAAGTNDFRICTMGPDGSTLYGAFTPAVAFNNYDGEYLVVWRGDDNTPPLVNDEFEIMGQRLSATGLQVGNNDFRISTMGPNGSTLYNAYVPAVAYSFLKNLYLVVWKGDHQAGLLADDEYEIFGQVLNSSGSPASPSNVRLSDMGPDGEEDFGANEPAVAYNSGDDEFLVVWSGYDGTLPLVLGALEAVVPTIGEFEIFSQRFNSSNWILLPLIQRGP